MAGGPVTASTLVQEALFWCGRLSALVRLLSGHWQQQFLCSIEVASFGPFVKYSPCCSIEGETLFCKAQQAGATDPAGRHAERAEP